MATTIEKIRADDAVAKGVKDEVQARVTSRDRFLDQFFQFDRKLVTSIYKCLVEQKLYDLTKCRWSHCPTSVSEQNVEFDQPLINIFRAISQTALSFSPSSESDKHDRVSAVWVEGLRHANVPKTRDAEVASIRPSIILAAMSEQKVKDLAKKIKAADTEIQAKEEKLNRARTTLQPTAAADIVMSLQKEIEGKKKARGELLVMWWRQTHIVAEIKRTRREPSDQNWIEILQQLTGYIRQIFREQLDRRFAFGLVLCFDQLTVWLYDRSGVIGTRTSFNIHRVGASTYF